MLLLVCIAICRKSALPDLNDLFKRLQFSAKRIRYAVQVRGAIMAARQGMAHWEKKDGSMRELHILLRKCPLETLLYILAREEQNSQHEKITRYIYMGLQMKADITGYDLVELGIPRGPLIGQILDEVLGAKMDNPNMDRNAQIDLALECYHQLCSEDTTPQAQS